MSWFLWYNLVPLLAISASARARPAATHNSPSCPTCDNFWSDSGLIVHFIECREKNMTEFGLWGGLGSQLSDCVADQLSSQLEYRGSTLLRHDGPETTLKGMMNSEWVNEIGFGFHSFLGDKVACYSTMDRWAGRDAGRSSIAACKQPPEMQAQKYVDIGSEACAGPRPMNMHEVVKKMHRNKDNLCCSNASYIIDAQHEIFRQLRSRSEELSKCNDVEPLPIWLFMPPYSEIDVRWEFTDITSIIIYPKGGIVSNSTLLRARMLFKSIRMLRELTSGINRPMDIVSITPLARTPNRRFGGYECRCLRTTPARIELNEELQ